MEEVKKSLLQNGLAPRYSSIGRIINIFHNSTRIHGNTKRLPYNTFSIEEISYAIRFITNYAQTNAILLPGRIPGYRSSTIQLLPSSTSKSNIWSIYSDNAEATGVRIAKKSYFLELWQHLLPHIIVCKPMSDLCWVCSKNSTAIVRSANKPDTEKSEVHREN